MMRVWSIAVCVSLFSGSLAMAQQAPRTTLEAATLAKDLVFPSAPSPMPTSGPRMGLHKPGGAGPFPALVLHHQCGGLGSSKWQNQSMLNWAKEGVRRGYVVLLIDSLTARSVDSVCYGAKGNVNFARGARDAMQAAEHLRKFEFVDKTRIAHVGHSWGAMVGLFASSRAVSASVGTTNHIAAFVSFYPGCFTIRPPTGNPYELVRQDIGRPLLVLMAGKDSETPPSDCIPKLSSAKAAGAPVEWHVYPDATHCWDCANLDGFSKVDVRGNRVVYRHDAAVTADSARRTFEFLERVWSRKP